MCFSGQIFADELVDKFQEQQIVPEMQPRYDISPLKSYLQEQVFAHEKILKLLPAKKMKKEDKVLFWMHTWKLQAYKEILKTLEMLEQNI